MNRMDGRVLWAFLVLGTVLITGLVARTFIPTDAVKVALLAWQQLVFVVGGVLGARREIFKPLRLRVFAWGLLSGVGLYMVNTALGAMTLGVVRQFLDHGTVQNLILRERAGVETLLTSSKPLVVTGAIILLIFGAPLGEELFFRGLLVDLWKERLGTKKAVFLGALIFAGLHFYVLQFVPVLVSGIILGLLFTRSKNILIPVMAHSVVNGLILLAWSLGL